MTPDSVTLRDLVLDTDFREWYREREHRRNARAGKFSRNTPSEPPAPHVHRPHTLLTCHRKQRYREANAPAEEPTPAGRFWIGTRIEEDLVLEYLSSLAPADVLVGNSLWIDATVETAAGELDIRGLTDPVFATRDGLPLLPIEVKTKRSLSNLDEPAARHRAQLHAYIFGLSATRDVDLSRGLVLYVGRDDLDARAFDVPFDETFWEERVLPWLAAQTHYRRESGLPPSVPERDWECDFCEFRHRCGKTDAPVVDAGFDAFVPGHKYPRDRVEAALAAGDDRSLTPTLAATYTDLAPEVAVTPLTCEACGATVPFSGVDWAGREPPTCDRCAESGRFARLRDPVPKSAPVVDLSERP